jgi:hypothetical protein
MNGKLTTLQGPGKPSPLFQNFKSLSDIDAGLLVMRQFADLNPGMTWRQLFAASQARRGNISGMGCPTSATAAGRQFMAGCDWWDLVCKGQNFVSDVIDVVGDAANWITDSAGNLVRLATDEDVMLAVTRAAAAYATGGQSEAILALKDQFLNLSPDKQEQVAAASGMTREQLLAIAATGATAKSSPMDIFKNPIFWGVAGFSVLTIGALAFSRKK